MPKRKRVTREHESHAARTTIITEMAGKLEAAAGTAVAESRYHRCNGAGCRRHERCRHRGCGTRASSAARASSETLENAQTVAAATEELAASIREISSRITDASAATQAAVQESQSTQTIIDRLRTEVEPHWSVLPH